MHKHHSEARLERSLVDRSPWHRPRRQGTPVRFRPVWIGRGAIAFTALVLVGVFLALAGVPDNTAQAHRPDCPSSVPTEEGEYFWTDSKGDEWFIIRQVQGSGYTTVKAYVASNAYDSGFVPSSSHETCVWKVRGQGNTEDLDPPEQIFPLADREHDDSNQRSKVTGTKTPQAQGPQPSAAFSLSLVPGDQDSDLLATVGNISFVRQGTKIVLIVAFSNLKPDSDASTTDYVYRIQVLQGSSVASQCQATGLNTVRQVNTNGGSSIQTAVISATCPLGIYVIKVELGAGDDTNLGSPIAENEVFIVVGPRSSASQPEPRPTDGNPNGNGNNDGGGSGGGGPNTTPPPGEGTPNPEPTSNDGNEGDGNGEISPASPNPTTHVNCSSEPKVYHVQDSPLAFQAMHGICPKQVSRKVVVTAYNNLNEVKTQCLSSTPIPAGSGNASVHTYQIADACPVGNYKLAVQFGQRGVNYYPKELLAFRMTGD